MLDSRLKTSGMTEGGLAGMMEGDLWGDRGRPRETRPYVLGEGGGLWEWHVNGR